MPPRFTFELKVHWSAALSGTDVALKQQVVAWFLNQGITSFVEGVVDGIDQDPPLSPDGAEQQHQAFEALPSPILLYSYDRDYLEGLAARIRASFSPASVEVSSMETADWATGWQHAFKPIETARFRVCPPWESSPGQDPARILITIDPGMAFGTGQHATTQLCLQSLEALMPRDKEPLPSMLDVGTGSGILAIASRKLGVGRIDACDIERDAIAATDSNVMLNAVQLDRTWVGGIDQADGSYHLIVANILAPVISDILPHIARLLDAGGWFVFSGVLDEQAGPILGSAAELGLVAERRLRQHDWVAITLRKEA